MKKWRNAIYVVQSLEGLAGGLVNIFVPIYFLSLGYGLKDIFLFFIVNNLAIALAFLLAGWLAEKVGLINTVIARLPILFINLFLLYNLKDYPSAFYLISVLSALEISLYWFVIHVVFANNSDESELGNQVAKFFAIPKLVGMFMPLIGASISAVAGFKALFVVVALIYGISIIPLVIAERDAKIIDFSAVGIKELWRQIRRLIFKEVEINLKRILKFCLTHKKYFTAEFFLGVIGEIEGYLLPIFLYLTFKNLLSVGALAAFLSLGSALFTLFVGSYTDKFDKKTILKSGALALAAVWVGRYFATTQAEFYVLSVLAGFFWVLVSVPFTAIIYKNAKTTHVANFVIFREIPISLGRTCLYLIGLLFVTKIKWSFILAALSYAYLLFF
jgi:MFS family permease